jgi:lipoprotein NlpD
MRCASWISGRSALLPALLISLSACGGPVKAPVSGRDGDARKPVPQAVQAPAPQGADRHTVVRGDTLYAIAWRYGLDYRDVARWNGIRDPYVIVPGQVIRLTAPGGTWETVRQPPPVTARTQPESSARQPAPPSPIAPRIPARTDTSMLRWQWPTTGQVIRADSPIARRGVSIEGRMGQDIRAAAPGSVVYSGGGLLGYGRLIIIKHNDTYLSAYAHNEKILVKEGDQVSSGQQIATMGLGNSGRPVLHFEIRRDGQPVNPLDHLPTPPS